MARLLATVLLMTGLTLLSPSPAHATLSVTISATKTTLMAGESTTIKGKAVGAKPGSVVKLQRKVSGVWRTVTQKKVWSTRTYSFTIKPPKGYQYYRVRKPRQLGQSAATSSPVKLAVRWRPSILISSVTAHADSESGQTVDITGKASGASGAVAHLEHRWESWSDGNVWVEYDGSEVILGAGGSFTFAAIHDHPAADFRGAGTGFGAPFSLRTTSRPRCRRMVPAFGSLSTSPAKSSLFALTRRPARTCR